MLRSPTVWEDVVKTLCTTNCSWGLTITMVNALVHELGEPAVGYADDPLHERLPHARRDGRPRRALLPRGRAQRLPGAVASFELAELVASGDVDLETLGDATRDELPDDEVERELLALPGHRAVRRGPRDDDARPELEADPGLLDPADIRPAAGRAALSPPTPRSQRRFRRYGPEAGLAFWLFVTQDWVD